MPAEFQQLLWLRRGKRVDVPADQLPIFANSGRIGAVKSHGVHRCLIAATVVSLMLARVVGAQEQEGQNQNPEQARPAAATQRLFVSDKLVLNVYAERDQGGGRVATIETGDAVDELERADNFVRVRLQDGREGWVGANYLTSDAPAATRLRELQREQKAGVDKKATDEIARLKKESLALQAQVSDLQSRAAAAAETGAVESDDATVASDEQQAPQVAAVASAESHGPSWIWPLVVVLAVGLGFAAGYRTLANRIRKKFGGLRIY
jgi:SH3 domain protein